MQHIRVRFSEDSIFGDYTGEDVDRPASVRSFTQHLEAALYDEYPEAEIEIVFGINDDHEVDGSRNSREAEDVGLIINKVWESWDWLQGADPDDLT